MLQRAWPAAPQKWSYTHLGSLGGTVAATKAATTEPRATDAELSHLVAVLWLISLVQARDEVALALAVRVVLVGEPGVREAGDLDRLGPFLERLVAGGEEAEALAADLVVAEEG